MNDANDAIFAANLLQTALSDAEIKELNDFVQFRSVPKGGMPLSMIDGFLTAIDSSPEFIVPSEWLPLVWSCDDAESVFESTQDAQRLTSLVLRRMNEITRNFNDGAVEPIFVKMTDEDGAEAVLADVWCAGYLRGMTVREDAWDPLVSPDNEASQLLMPIFALALPLLTDDEEEDDLDGEDDERDSGDHNDDEDVDDGDDDEDLDEDDAALSAVLNGDARDEFAELVTHAALAIHQYWRDQPLRQTTLRRTPQPGRNAPCPCGSGRKYKKCCGKS